MATQPKHFISLEEYFQQERTALDRHEYLNGEVLAMTGGTRATPMQWFVAETSKWKTIRFSTRLSLSKRSRTARKVTTGAKNLKLYRQIASFREYLIVAQDRLYVEHHAREHQDHKVWIMREYTSLDDVITLGAIK